MAEIAFEVFAAALETARGTAVTPPTHYFPLIGSLTPNVEHYRPEESRGTLAQYYRSTPVRKNAEWEAEGGLDADAAPFLFSMAIKGGVTPTTPGGATNTRLWTYAPTMTADDVRAATLYFGDPNVQIWQAPFAMVDSLEISADASGTDGATISMSGQAQFPAKVAAPTFPAQTVGPLLMPGAMQVWLDTASGIGTTALTGRVVSATFSLDNNLGYKYLAAGPAPTLTYSRVGRGKRNAESRVVFELADTAQYDLFAAGTLAKLRVRLNGPLIESTFYRFVEWDIYGPLDQLAWGELESTNRTIELTITSQYDATAGHDFALRAQNTKTTI